MKLKSGTIQHLQDYIAYKIKERGFEDETTEERLILFVEEVGELMKAYRRSGKKEMNVSSADTHESHLGEEITDIINMIFAIGISLGIDIEKEFIEKNEIVDQRKYSRLKK